MLIILYDKHVRNIVAPLSDLNRRIIQLCIPRQMYIYTANR